MCAFTAVIQKVMLRTFLTLIQVMTLHLTVRNLNLCPYSVDRPKVMQSILGPINSGTSTSLRNLILSSSLLLIHSHAAKQAEANDFCMSIALRALAAVPFTSCVCFVAMTTDGCECLGFYGSLYFTVRDVWIENWAVSCRSTIICCSIKNRKNVNSMFHFKGIKRWNGALNVVELLKPLD